MAGDKETIIYVGEDDSYYDDVKLRFKQQYDFKDYKFVKLDDSENYLKHFVQILKLEPIIVFIDFTVKPKERTYLTRLLKREGSTKDIPTVALVEKREQLKECNSTRVDFAHIKCGEMSDIIYDPCYIAYTKSVKKPEFARAKFNKDVQMREDFRISYFSPTHMHVESDMFYSKGDILELNTEINKKIMPSNHFIVRAAYTSDLYYDYKFGYDLDYVFVDKPELEEVDGDEKVTEMVNQEKITEYKDNLRFSKKKVQAWVQDNLSDQDQKTKILIIDKNMQFITEQEKSLDEYNYIFRIKTELEELDELDKVRPSIIAFQFYEIIEDEEDEEDEDGKKKPKKDKKKDEAPKANAIEQLTLLVKKIKTMQNYSPFIVVFNCVKFTSQSFQDSFQFPMILADRDLLNFDKLIEFAKVYEKKQKTKLESAIKTKVAQLKKQDPTKYRRLSVDDFKEKRFYPKSSSPLSFASCSYLIQLTSMTESDLTFTAEEEFIGDQFRLTFPVPMYFRIVPVDEKKFTVDQRRNLYVALIHSVGEEEKKKIRQFVNEIFFTELTLKREKEKEEFKLKNEAALAEKDKSKQTSDQELDQELDQVKKE